MPLEPRALLRLQDYPDWPCVQMGYEEKKKTATTLHPEYYWAMIILTAELNLCHGDPAEEAAPAPGR